MCNQHSSGSIICYNPKKFKSFSKLFICMQFDNLYIFNAKQYKKSDSIKSHFSIVIFFQPQPMQVWFITNHLQLRVWSALPEHTLQHQASSLSLERLPTNENHSLLILYVIIPKKSTLFSKLFKLWNFRLFENHSISCGIFCQVLRLRTYISYLYKCSLYFIMYTIK